MAARAAAGTCLPPWPASQPWRAGPAKAVMPASSSISSSEAATPAGSIAPPAEPLRALTRAHTRRLREIYRSAGWPSQDLVEIELLALGLVERLRTPAGHETLRLTESGVQAIAQSLTRNRAAMSAHEALVERVAREMARAGRIVWRGLSLRAQVPHDAPDRPLRWCMARPDVFSIRHTSVEAYVEPVVHEVKVRRADLLGDLRSAGKRAAYLDMGECWYVLGCDAKGRPIAEPDEVPRECGVLMADGSRLSVARAAPRRERKGLPFGLWMALARATPVSGLDEGAQALLGETAELAPD